MSKTNKPKSSSNYAPSMREFTGISSEELCKKYASLEIKNNKVVIKPDLKSKEKIMARKKLGMNINEMTVKKEYPNLPWEDRVMEMDKVQLLTKVIMTLTEEIEHYVNHGKMRQDLLYTDDGIWVDSAGSKYSINISLEWHEEKPVELHAKAYPITLNKKGYLEEDTTADPIVIIGSGEL